MIKKVTGLAPFPSDQQILLLDFHLGRNELTQRASLICGILAVGARMFDEPHGMELRSLYLPLTQIVNQDNRWSILSAFDGASVMACAVLAFTSKLASTFLISVKISRKTIIEFSEKYFV